MLYFLELVTTICFCFFVNGSRLAVTDQKLTVWEIELNRTPLMHAVVHSQLDEVRQLLEQGADPNAIDDDGFTALMFTGSRPFATQTMIVKLLLDHGANISARDFFGDGVLHRSAVTGNLEIVKLLSDRGADVNMKNLDGETPLMRAAAVGQFSVAEFLLDRGADINATDKDGHTAVMCTHNDEIERLLVSRGISQQDCDCIVPETLHGINVSSMSPNRRLLQGALRDNMTMIEGALRDGASIHARDQYGDTALLLTDNVDTARFLLDRGVNISATWRYGRQKIWEAVSSNEFDMAKLLLDRGADPNASMYTGYSTLMAAVSTNNSDAVNLLLNRGADINAKAKSGKTALIYAAIKNLPDIASLLIRRGASRDGCKLPLCRINPAAAIMAKSANFRNGMLFNHN